MIKELKDELLEEEERLDAWWETVSGNTKSLFTSTIAEYITDFERLRMYDDQSHEDMIWDDFGVLVKNYIMQLVEYGKGKNNPHFNLTEFVAEALADTALAYKKGCEVDDMNDENDGLREEFIEEYKVEFNKIMTKISIFSNNVIN